MPAPVAYDKEGRKYGRGSAKNLARKSAMSERALDDLARWIGEQAPAAAAE